MSDCSHTHPASLLKVDQTTLRRTQRARCQTLNITYQRLLRQTALGAPLQKWTDKIPHALMETYAPVTDSGYTDGLSDVRSCVNSQTHALKSRNTHTSANRHTHTHTHNQQVLRVLPLLGQAGPYPAWLDQ